MKKAFPIVVLVSGQGSNLQAIIDAKLPIEIKAVISNRSDAYALKRAEQAGISSVILDHRLYKTREEYDQALADCISRYQPKLIVLAGFMRLLSRDFIRQFYGRIINIHPSLLPKYPGLHTHEQVVAAGDKVHGVSVHFVDDQLDGGPLIAQAETEVGAADTAATLKTKVHQLEHRIYPQVIRWFAEDRLRLDERRVFLDSHLLTASGRLLKLIVLD